MDAHERGIMRLPRKIKVKINIDLQYKCYITSQHAFPERESTREYGPSYQASTSSYLYACQANPAHAGFIGLTKWSDKDSTSSYAALVPTV